MIRSALLLLVTAFAAGPARAQAGPGEAKFAEGQRAYGDGRYDDAARLFLEGYALEPRAEWLLNVGQAYRRARRLDDARTYYERFLAQAPDSPLRPRVAAILAAIERERSEPPPTPPPEIVPPPEPVAAPKPPPPVAEPAPPAGVPATAAAAPKTGGGGPAPWYARAWVWGAAAVVVGGAVAAVLLARGGQDEDGAVECGSIGTLGRGVCP